MIITFFCLHILSNIFEKVCIPRNRHTHIYSHLIHNKGGTRERAFCYIVLRKLEPHIGKNEIGSYFRP